MTKGIWGYDKGGRYYKRTTGTRRYPDSGNVKSDGKTISKEKTGKHHYGQDRGKVKRKFSKKYRSHSFISHGRKATRGGYRRALR